MKVDRQIYATFKVYSALSKFQEPNASKRFVART